ncbi:hypothetical protein RB195_006212 [Necator americanus]|uniref:Uncharacterized protein n=1 Tax=Necator americanus TaxID=51031 RepID=A0ABR1BRI4_NECAM
MDVDGFGWSPGTICAVDDTALYEAYQHCMMLNKQVVLCTSRGSSGFITLTPAIHTVHGHDNEGNLEAASVDPTLCRRFHARAGDDLQKQVQSWKDWLQRHGLRLNVSKNEYMERGRRREDGSVRVDGIELN